MPGSETSLSPLGYILRADAQRRSRFHDVRGNVLPLPQWPEAISAFVTASARHVIGYRPTTPWIPRLARVAIDSLLTPHSKVLEFGSGMSTVWLARRCGFVHSIEHDATWHRGVTEMLREHKVDGRVKYELKPDDGYADMSEYPDGIFDLCVVDGVRRAECARSAISKVRAGGYLYWDNSDYTDPDSMETERVISSALEVRGGTMQRFMGFPPTTFHVNQGLLVKLGGRA